LGFPKKRIKRGARSVQERPPFVRDLIFPCSVAEEPTKLHTIVAPGVVPPAPAGEQTKERGVDDAEKEGPKDEDEDAMDVEQTSVHPPFREATTSERTREHPADVHLSADRKDGEGGPRAR
jgi:hypothetical protein